MENTVILSDNINQAMLWAVENLAKESFTFDVLWPHYKYLFRFADKSTATLFALKWA